MKKCSYCSEEIQDSAKKCRFCGEWLKNNSKDLKKEEKPKEKKEEIKKENEENNINKKTTEKIKSRNKEDKKKDFNKLLESIFTIIPAMFIGAYGFYLMGLGVFILILLFGVFGFFGYWLSGKTKEGKWDSIIKWSNLIIGIIPFLGVFSAIYVFSKHKLNNKASYLYLGIWGIMLSLINAIWGTIDSVNGTFNFLSEGSIKAFAFSIIIGIIAVSKEYHKYMKEKYSN